MYKVLLKTTSLLPLSVGRSLGRRLGDLYYRFNSKHVRAARVNMEICYPELSQTEREDRVRRNLQETGAWFMEAGPVWMWPQDRILKQVTVTNPEVYQQALAQGRGVILAIPHLGNWEVLAPLISRDSQFACFYKPANRTPGFSEFLRQQRSRSGTVMAPTDSSGVRCLYKHLKAGKVVGLLPDHNPSDEMGVFAPFFGRPALTGTLLSSLARKHRTPVLTAAAVRTHQGFDVHFGEVEDQHSEDPVLAATSLNRAIEQCIALAPDQFQWVYPRFKKRPNPDQVDSPYRLARS